MKKTLASCEKLPKNGQLLSSNPLEPVERAITLRVRNSGVSLTDGPFTETKEQIPGCFLIEARHINQAIQIPSRFPSCASGVWKFGP